jgi:hypothetical protein
LVDREDGAGRTGNGGAGQVTDNSTEVIQCSHCFPIVSTSMNGLSSTSALSLVRRSSTEGAKLLAHAFFALGIPVRRDELDADAMQRVLEAE